MKKKINEFYLLEKFCSNDVESLECVLFKTKQTLLSHLTSIFFSSDEKEEIIKQGKTFWRKNNYKLRVVEYNI